MFTISKQNVFLNYIEISNFLRNPVSNFTRAKFLYRHRELALHRTGHDCRCLHQSCRSLQEEAQNTAPSITLEKFKASLAFPKDTAHMRDLTIDVWKGTGPMKVTLHGYLGVRRDQSKDLSFALLVDPDNLHEVQITAASKDDAARAAQNKLKSIRRYTPVVVTGILKLRPPKDRQGLGLEAEINPDSLKLGDLEVILEDIQSLNEIDSNVTITPESQYAPEDRHLQLRTDKRLSQALALRDTIARACREKLHVDLGFTEVETPLLFKSTSEGAREFLVPTRRKGLAYSLPQSPQQFKQMLMASGIHRYFQIAKCFRDEDLRADRQPEFTQLDIEASFCTGHDIMKITEKVVKNIWKDALSVILPRTFQRKTYERAMSEYGSDKPDLRIPIKPFTRVDFLLPVDLILKITSVENPIVEAMVVPLKNSPDLTRNFIGQFLDSADNKSSLNNPDGGPGIFIYDTGAPLRGLAAFGFEAVESIEEELDVEDGNLIVLQARKQRPFTGGSTALGGLRTAIYKAAIAQGLLPTPDWKHFEPLWITNFPLFSPPTASEPGQGGNAGLTSTHHPFTSPNTPEDVDLLLTDPSKAIADHYDLVINGEEIGGGSRRIHYAEMQLFIFRDILKMKEKRIAEFDHLIKALRTGCPPHAGIALGFDRIAAMVASSKLGEKMTLRDVIAFPKGGKGEDAMVKSPAAISEEDLRSYHLKLRD